jgi:hypothetical protein
MLYNTRCMLGVCVPQVLARRPGLALRLARRHVHRHRWTGVVVAAGVQTLSDAVPPETPHVLTDMLHFLSAFILMSL